MRFLLIIILSVFTIVNVNAQTNEMVGFACGFAGSSTNTVSKFDKLLFSKNLLEIKTSLFSKSPSDQFLAAVILETLVLEEKIELEFIFTHKINSIRLSDELISYCSGCTVRQIVSISEIFDKKEFKSQIHLPMISWVKSHLLFYKW